MKAVLICPADRPAATFLARQYPLALVPILGRSLLDLWLSEMANRGATRVLVLAADRPDDIRRSIGRGEAWGLAVEVLPETREPSIDAVRDRYKQHEVFVIEGLPPSGPSIWTSPTQWFHQMIALIPLAAASRVGYRELSRGVWIHRRARVSPNARLEGPCWIGQNAWVGSRAEILAGSVVEDNSYIDEGAEVSASWVGPGTYVGAFTKIRNSLAWGHGLYHVESHSFVEVTDSFLMCGIGSMARQPTAGGFIGRLLALIAMVVSSPLVLVALLRREQGQPLFQRRQAIRAPTSAEYPLTCDYFEMAGLDGLFRRWPELLNVIRGEFSWVGNRPLTRDESKSLADEFERLWTTVSPGIFSLADAEGCVDPFGDEARAHASFYAVQHSWKTDLHILLRSLVQCFNPKIQTQKPPEPVKTASV